MKNVVLLGIVSLFTDASTEMILPLLPIFLTQVLHAGPLAVGWIEGLADATASVLKVVSGRWSDAHGKRKPFVVAGYGISSSIRPLIALALSPWHVLAVRVIDRVGKGMRSSPRDALIAASTPEEKRGAAFGLHRAFDHAGAVIGPLFAFAFLTWWSNDLRILFWWSAVPGALAMLVLIFAVAEPYTAPPAPAPEAPRDSRLVRLLFPLGLFTLGNASDVFLLLKANAENSPITSLPLLWMGLHVVKVVASLFGGRLADRWGRRRIIIVGWIFYAAIYSGFAVADDRRIVWALFLAYGIHHGLTEGAERALVAEVVPKRRWGAGFGWYHLTLGALGLAASVLFGALWEQFGSSTAFFTSAGLAVAASACLFLLSR
jgi:MFS family permease